MAAASSAEMIPCLASMSAWARLPKISSRHIRLSVPIELFIARINAAGPPWKRPPHIGLELSVRFILLLLGLLAIAGCDRQKPEVQQGNDVAAADAGPQKGIDR